MQERVIKVEYSRPRGYDVGYRAENNFTVLALPVPAELKDADSYRVYFESTVGEHLQTEPLTPADGYVTVKITSDVVPEPGNMAAQLVAFGAGEIVGYSPVITGTAKVSIPDGTERLGHSLAAEIALNTAARHDHDNKAVLDKFAESDGEPTYDGQVIGGGGSTESELFIVNVQAQSGAGGYTITSHNKTYEQIDAAYKAGKQVLIAFTVTNENNTFLIPLGIATETDYEFLVFANAVFYVYVDNTDTWDCYVEPLEADSIKAKISADSSAQSLSLQTILNSLVYPAVKKAHEHNNEDVLDKLSVSGGKLQYNGSDVSLKPAYYIDLAGTYPSYTCPVAMDDIKAAYSSGYNLVCRCALGAYTATLPLFIPMPAANTWIFSGSGALESMNFSAQSFTVAITANGVAAQKKQLMPFPTPNKLKITAGDIHYHYDGSFEVSFAVQPATQLVENTGGGNITLADNTEYRLTDVTTLTLTYPTGNFECWMRLNFAASGNVTVTLPTGTKYIGTAPDFKNGETWELSFKDKILAAQKVGEGT